MKKIKKIAVVALSLSVLSSMPVFAAEPYSPNWETQADNSWKYKLSNNTYASGWIQDEIDLNWYYMDASQTMLSGLVKSNENHYYLLSQVHDGHFGRMLTNGSIYNGITIQAETSGAYVGALTETTLNQLRNLGLTVEGARDVSGSQHISGGRVTSGGNDTTSQNNQTSGGEKTGSELFKEITDIGGSTGAHGDLHG